MSDALTHVALGGFLGRISATADCRLSTDIGGMQAWWLAQPVVSSSLFSAEGAKLGFWEARTKCCRAGLAVELLSAP